MSLPYNASVSAWIYGQKPLGESAERLKRYGYQGIEVPGYPDLTAATVL